MDSIMEDTVILWKIIFQNYKSVLLPDEMEPGTKIPVKAVV
jgi:hypothetical protein